MTHDKHSAASPAALVYNPETHGPLLDPKEAVAYLLERHGIKRSVGRMADMRVSGLGPVFLKQGRSVKYARSMLDAWAKVINGLPMRTHTPFGLAAALEEANAA